MLNKEACTRLSDDLLPHKEICPHPNLQEPVNTALYGKSVLHLIFER